MVEEFGIDSIVSAKTATADAILSYVRARKNSQASANIETMYQLVDEQVEALEFIIRSETRYTGIPLKDLALKSNNLIACIARKREIIIPGGDDCIEVGDSVILVTMDKHIEDLKDITNDPHVLNIITLRECIKNHNTLEYFNYKQKVERKEET